MQFPTPVQGQPAASAPLVTPNGAAAPVYPAPNTLSTVPPTLNAPPPQTYGGVTPPGGWDQYADPALQQGLQPATPYSPYAPSPYAPPPTQPLYPEGLQSAVPNNYFGEIGNPLRLLQEFRVRYTWLYSNNNANSLGVNEVQTSATLAFPIMQNQAPLLVTPGFGTTFFQGPLSSPPLWADLPGSVYDAYIDVGWHPQITPYFGMNLGVRVGVYTDFNTFTNRSIREMGRGLGVLTLTPTVQVAAGVVYLDRVKLKLLPAGGIIWTPNDDARYEILFPNPKLARRYSTVGSAEIWYFISGEYGGGSWTIKRGDLGQPVSGSSDSVDYNDIRVAIGLESFATNGNKWTFEVAYVFNRDLRYRSGQPNEFDLQDTVLLQLGFSR